MLLTGSHSRRPTPTRRRRRRSRTELTLAVQNMATGTIPACPGSRSQCSQSTSSPLKTIPDLRRPSGPTVICAGTCDPESAAAAPAGSGSHVRWRGAELGPLASQQWHRTPASIRESAIPPVPRTRPSTRPSRKQLKHGTVRRSRWLTVWRRPSGSLIGGHAAAGGLRTGTLLGSGCLKHKRRPSALNQAAVCLGQLTGRLARSASLACYLTSSTVCLLTSH